MNVTFRFCFRSPLKSLKLPVFKGLSTDLGSHSFLHISFYPLYYDLLCTKIVMPEDTEELALTLNGRKRKIQKSDFVKVMTASGLSEKVINNIAKKFRRSIVKWLDLIEASFLPDSMKKEYKKLILSRVMALR